MTSNIDHKWRTTKDVFTFLGIQELGAGQEYIGHYKSSNKYDKLKAIIKHSKTGDKIEVSIHKPNQELAGNKHIKFATFKKDDQGHWTCTTTTNYGLVVSREYNKGDVNTSLATRVSRLSDKDDRLEHDQLREAFRIEAQCAGRDYNRPRDVLKSIQSSISKTQEDGGRSKYQESSILDRLNPIKTRLIPS